MCDLERVSCRISHNACTKVTFPRACGSKKNNNNVHASLVHLKDCHIVTLMVVKVNGTLESKLQYLNLSSYAKKSPNSELSQIIKIRQHLISHQTGQALRIEGSKVQWRGQLPLVKIQNTVTKGKLHIQVLSFDFLKGSVMFSTNTLARHYPSWLAPGVDINCHNFYFWDVCWYARELQKSSSQISWRKRKAAQDWNSTTL